VDVTGQLDVAFSAHVQRVVGAQRRPPVAEDDVALRLQHLAALAGGGDISLDRNRLSGRPDLRRRHSEQYR
jgi:hypothetical protein